MSGPTRWISRHFRRQPPPPPGALVWFRHGDEFYVMAPARGSAWVQAVHESAGRVAMTHGEEQVEAQLTELPVPESAAVLADRLREATGQLPAEEVRRQFGIGPDADAAQIRSVAHNRPMFRIDDAPLAVEA